VAFSLSFLIVLPQKSSSATHGNGKGSTDATGATGATIMGQTSKESRVRDLTVSLMVYDLLFGRGIQLKAELARIKERDKAQSNEDLLPDHVRNPVIIPRFARVNTLKITVKDAIKKLVACGFSLKETNKDSAGKIPAENEFWRDLHLAELLLFAPNTDFHLNELYLAGELVLQDKASCFPAIVLNPAPKSLVIDACAAPGNKTSHLSSLMKNTGRIFAFDISSRRLDLLKKLTGNVGATNIQGPSPQKKKKN
jgi:putative methyltransferase